MIFREKNFLKLLLRFLHQPTIIYRYWTGEKDRRRRMIPRPRRTVHPAARGDGLVHRSSAGGAHQSGRGPVKDVGSPGLRGEHHPDAQGRGNATVQGEDIHGLRGDAHRHRIFVDVLPLASSDHGTHHLRGFARGMTGPFHGHQAGILAPLVGDRGDRFGNRGINQQWGPPNPDFQQGFQPCFP